jgi:flavin reductase (NADH)
MSLLSAAVNVITTDGPHGRYGMTASAVCSVTDTPPTLLICVNQKSLTHQALISNGKACVNVLPADHEELARRFAGMGGVNLHDRFSGQTWQEGPGGQPMLEDALASLEGVVRERKEVGSHSVIFLEVHAVRQRSDGDALTYFGRSFHRLERTARSA